MCAFALNQYVDVSTLNISIFEVYPLNTFLPLHTHAQKREPVQNSAKGGHLHIGPWALTRQNCLPDIHLELPASRTVRNTFQPASVFCYSSLS